MRRLERRVMATRRGPGRARRRPRHGRSGGPADRVPRLRALFNQDGNACRRLGAPPCLQARSSTAPPRSRPSKGPPRRPTRWSSRSTGASSTRRSPAPRTSTLAHRARRRGRARRARAPPARATADRALPARRWPGTASIAYSLGNFVSNQSRNYVPGVTPAPVAATRDGALAARWLARTRLRRRRRARGGRGRGLRPLWTENDTVEIDRAQRAERRPRSASSRSIRALAQVRAELARFPDPVPIGPTRVRRGSASASQLLASRRAAVAAARRGPPAGAAPRQLATAPPRSRPPAPPTRATR